MYGFGMWTIHKLYPYLEIGSTEPILSRQQNGQDYTSVWGMKGVSLEIIHDLPFLRDPVRHQVKSVLLKGHLDALSGEELTG